MSCGMNARLSLGYRRREVCQPRRGPVGGRLEPELGRVVDGPEAQGAVPRGGDRVVRVRQVRHRGHHVVVRLDLRDCSSGSEHVAKARRNHREFGVA